MGPTQAISRLLDGSHMASLNSCTPVSANCTATTTKIPLVTTKNRPKGILSVP